MTLIGSYAVPYLTSTSNQVVLGSSVDTVCVPGPNFICAGDVSCNNIVCGTAGSVLSTPTGAAAIGSIQANMLYLNGNDSVGLPALSNQGLAISWNNGGGGASSEFINVQPSTYAKGFDFYNVVVNDMSSNAAGYTSIASLYDSGIILNRNTTINGDVSCSSVSCSSVSCSGVLSLPNISGITTGAGSTGYIIESYNGTQASVTYTYPTPFNTAPTAVLLTMITSSAITATGIGGLIYWINSQDTTGITIDYVCSTNSTIDQNINFYYLLIGGS